jgi:multiple sugar transport system ATP-binding protein
MTMADKIAVLRAGRVEQFGKPLDLFNAPQNRFVAGFIGSPAMNFMKGAVRGGVIELENGAKQPLGADFTAQDGQAVELGIRAGDLSMAEDGNGIKAQVAGIEQLGAESYLYCRTSQDEPITVHQRGQTGVEKGQEITLTFDATAMHLFDLNDGATCRKGA